MNSVSAEGLKVLICAPFGRDGEGAAKLVVQAGFVPAIARNLDDIAAALGPEIGAVLLTDDALRFEPRRLTRVLAEQPPWSDIPLILLSARRTRPTRDHSYERVRGQLAASNVIILERPLSSNSLISAIASAIKSRVRQLQMRDRLEELARARETLEQRVQERTAELNAEMENRAKAEAALRQSQKMEAVGQLTGGIAHDFNNMLTGVIGSLDLMRRRMAAGRADDLNRYMDAASASARRAAALTQRLLAFSRRQSLDAKPVEVDELIQSMDDLLQRATNEQIDLRFGLAADLPPAQVDPNQLESAILNLVINARDAMPTGGELTIETQLVEVDEAYARAKPGIAPGPYVIIAVSDTGVGMSPELLEQVFDPFFTTKPLGQGTGLGLSMVYGFASQSGGQVRIHSQPGVGTSVKIYLPATTATPATLIDVSAGGPPRGAGERVLVVEDDEAVRMLVREVLEELQYKVTEFADPLAAVPYLASNEQIDLMISDVGLPGMNGRELAEVARSHRPNLPILFVTGYAENAAIRAGFLGANMEMITKPFSLDDLARKITATIAVAV